jgi:hypothetical protein
LLLQHRRCQAWRRLTAAVAAAAAAVACLLLLLPGSPAPRLLLAGPAVLVHQKHILRHLVVRLSYQQVELLGPQLAPRRLLQRLLGAGRERRL